MKTYNLMIIHYINDIDRAFTFYEKPWAWNRKRVRMGGAR
jgi:predicted enzyme related to lactoylglutathione lyase